MKIYNSDFKEAFKILDDRSVDAFITDPPYGINVRDNETRKRASWDLGGKIDKLNSEIVTPLLDLIKLKLNTNGFAMLFCSQYYFIQIGQLILNHGFVINNSIIWTYNNGMRRTLYTFPMGWEMIFMFGFKKKTYFRCPRDPENVQIGNRTKKNYKKDGTFTVTTTYPNPKGIKYTDILSVPRLTGKRREGAHHPTPKPLKLMEILVSSVSKENALICDPFLGSGTTAVAAYKFGHDFIGFEKEKKYCDVAKERLNACFTP